MVFPSPGGQNVEAVVRRDGDVQRQADSNAEQSATTTAVDSIDPGADAAPAEQEEERSWERTSTGNRQLPNPDVVFKCVDAETAVVVGSTEDERKGRFVGDACPDEASASSPTSADEKSMESSRDNQALRDHFLVVPSSLDEEKARQSDHQKSGSLLDRDKNSDDAQCVGSARGAAPTVAKSAAVTVAGDRKGGGSEANGDQHPSPPSMPSPRQAPQQPPAPPPSPPPGKAVGSGQSAQDMAAEAVRPQVWVPLMGAGDSGCIGIIGVQGFTTGALVDDEDWRDWFMHRMEPLNRGDNRNVKRLRLVRPRGLPDKGRLEHAPTGIAAKVVYGSVEKISRKRGMPVYAVR